MAAATAIPPSEQRTMAEGMVARLEGRLKADPKNVEGWIMLMRSRMTLGEAAHAKQALASALAANPGDADRLRQEAAALGVN
jgi:cytochrome c-type biogenesis protein CcmH